jgi:hypothetical protein
MALRPRCALADRLHLTRFVGFNFLLLYYRDGALPWAFAVPGEPPDHVPVPLIIAGHVVVFYRLGGSVQ